jgi:hypothetical protein
MAESTWRSEPWVKDLAVRLAGEASQPSSTPMQNGPSLLRAALLRITAR